MLLFKGAPCAAVEEMVPFANFDRPVNVLAPLILISEKIGIEERSTIPRILEISGTGAIDSAIFHLLLKACHVEPLPVVKALYLVRRSSREWHLLLRRAGIRGRCRPLRYSQDG